MNAIQRDLGRIEATQEIMKEDVKQIKTDLADIKDALAGQRAVKETDWKRLSILGLVVTIVNQIINGYRFFS